jgi:hypothetical protein
MRTSRNGLGSFKFLTRLLETQPCLFQRQRPHLTPGGNLFVFVLESRDSLEALSDRGEGWT